MLKDLALARQVYANFTAMWEAVGTVAMPSGVFEVTRRPDMLFVRSLLVHRVPHMVIDPTVEAGAAPAWASSLVREMQGQAGTLMISMPPGLEDGALEQALRKEGFTHGSPSPACMARVGGPRLDPWRDDAVMLADAEPYLSVARGLLARVFGLPHEVFAFYTPPALVSTYLLHDQGKAVAAACLCPFGHTAGIYSVGVLPEARGRGFARRLIRRALQDAEEMGFELEVLTCDAALAPLYQRAGFRACWRTTTMWMESWWR
ncbi:MAG: GNAT family N-acetyltransferase [Chloroflexota bacterium]